MRSPILLLLLVLASTATLYGQAPTPPSQARPISPVDDDGDRRDRFLPGLGELIANQRMARQKKAHAEMLKRGEEALKITEDIQRSFEANGRFTDDDIDRLATLEKTVEKIRENLGGDFDDDKWEVVFQPSSFNEAFDYLRSTTIALVNELKKTSRFVISVGAIQATNDLIRVAKFLRLQK